MLEYDLATDDWMSVCFRYIATIDKWDNRTNK